MVLEIGLVDAGGVGFGGLGEELLVPADALFQVVDHLFLADELVLEMFEIDHDFALGQVLAGEFFQAALEGLDFIFEEIHFVDPDLVLEVQVA